MAVTRKSDLSLDVEKIGEVLEQEKPKCTFLTSTNNPDGRYYARGFKSIRQIYYADLMEFLIDLRHLEVQGAFKETETIVVCRDKYAYPETKSKFEPTSQVQASLYIAARSLLLLDSFTGLAELLVGYEAFPLSIIEYLWTAKQPYNVSAAAEISACAALKNPVYLEEDLAEMGVMIRHYNNKELSGYVRVSRAHGCLNGGSQTPILISFQSCERII
ncbi:Histidinol-phosphate aminotransferase 2 [Forsythia ovata]|uniref:histidinol-phosphate transaminase n=1 Tax=Forsythia ovata TaxID=205694 RepID=A0ABD1WCD5_9LAMI